MESNKQLPWVDFAVPTHQQWHYEATTALKGGSIEEKLVKPTYEGFKLKPLYTSADIETHGEIFLSKSRPHWRVAQDFGVVTLSHQENLLRDVEYGGVDEVQLDATSPALLGLLGQLGGKAVVLTPHHNLKKLFSIIERTSVTHTGEGSVGFDPLSYSDEDYFSELQLLLEHRKMWPNWRLMTASGVSYHEYGASESIELATTLATAIEYLRSMEKAGLDLSSSARLIDFRMALTPEFFLSVAKVRALRFLWKQILFECGVKNPEDPILCVQSSRRHLTKRDPWINILRGTTSTWAGAVGGATSIVVTPFDALCGESDKLAQRLSINTQLILKEESHLGLVEDSGYGSYFIETLTSELMESCWTHLQKIEATGGMRAYINQGMVNQEIDSLYQERIKNISKRKEGITGVSEYPLLSEVPLKREKHHLPLSTTRLSLRRPVELFESFRDQSDLYVEKKGYRPRVMMVTLGALSLHFARSHFTQNFLEVGGFEVISVDGEKTVEELHKLFQKMNSSLVVLSAPDALYLSDGKQLIEKVRSAGAKKVILAGRILDTMKEWGLDTNLYMGCDMVATLKQFWSWV